MTQPERKCVKKITNGWFIVSIFNSWEDIEDESHDACLHFVRAGYVIEPLRNVYVVTVT